MGKKDKVLTIVNSGLTDAQASDLLSAFSKAKSKIAPNSSARAAKTTKKGVAGFLSGAASALGLYDDNDDDD